MVTKQISTKPRSMHKVLVKSTGHGLINVVPDEHLAQQEQLMFAKNDDTPFKPPISHSCSSGWLNQCQTRYTETNGYWRIKWQLMPHGQHRGLPVNFNWIINRTGITSILIRATRVKDCPNKHPKVTLLTVTGGRTSRSVKSIVNTGNLSLRCLTHPKTCWMYIYINTATH